MADMQKPVYTANEIKRQLREENRDVTGERTWGDMYGAASVRAEKSQGALQQSYREAVVVAYDSYLQNKMAITSSNLIGESQETLLDQQKSALTDAYNSYRNNLQQGKSEILRDYQQEITAIDDALSEQAEYTTNYLNRFGDYYTYLTEQYGDALINDEIWNTRYGIDAEEDGKTVHRLSTWEELRSKMYDENQELTRFGVDVIDQLENAQIGQIVNDELLPTWGDFLYSEDEDLYNWATQYNAYNFTTAGTNIGTIKAMTGRLSTDEEYSFLERWGGLTEEQTNKIFGKFEERMKAFNSISSEKKKNKGKQIVGNVADAIGELNSFASSLGIDTELDQAFIDAGLPGGFKTLQEDLQKFKSGTLSEAQMTARWFGQTGASGAGGIVAGELAGGAVAGLGALLTTAGGSAMATGTALAGGTAVGATGVATAGAALTAAAPIVVGVVALALVGYGIYSASKKTHEKRKRNKRMANNAIQLYQQAVNSTLMYAQSKARAAEQQYMLN